MSKNSQVELQLIGTLTTIYFVHYLKVKNKKKNNFNFHVFLLLLLLLLLFPLLYFSKLRDYWYGIYYPRLVYLRKKAALLDPY